MRRSIYSLNYVIPCKILLTSIRKFNYFQYQLLREEIEKLKEEVNKIHLYFFFSRSFLMYVYIYLYIIT